MPPSRLPWLAAWLALAALLVGCGSSQAKPPRLVVQAPRDVNDGKPVYMMLRAVDEATFAAESYQAVAAKVVTPDDSVLLAEAIYPSTSPSFEVTPPEKKALGVYFFFTRPGGPWRKLLTAPLPKETTIELERDRIKDE